MSRSLLPLLAAGLALGAPEYMAPERRQAPRPSVRRPKPQRGPTPPAVSSPDERIGLDALICDALGKLPGESILDAAKRVMAEPRGSDAWKVATVVLHPRRHEEPWSVMWRAAKVARRIGAAS